MELHTLGVNGGYTQQDVTEVARVFTGWTIDQPRQGGGFVFRPRLHEPGDKTVLGHTIKQDGENEGMRGARRSLAAVRRPRASSRPSWRSASSPTTRRKSLIDAMAKTFLKTDGDLREVMRTMFRSPEFWAPEAYRARVKTPFEFVASSLRATEAEVSDPLPLLAAAEQDGACRCMVRSLRRVIRRKSDVWVNSAALLDRMNFGLGLAANKIAGHQFQSCAT